MGLSSNILWHQTNYANLRNIIKSRSLKCSYSLEEVDEILGQKVAFPMISMCDLPISELSEYQGKYGDYAIGLSREWGVKKKFTPIWYYEPKSRVPQLLRKLLDEAVKNDSDNILSIFGMVSFMKKMEGPLPRHNYSKYRFYDEREVRYVPSFDYLASGRIAPVLSANDYNNYKAAHGGKALIEDGLNFSWADIRYIIVKEDKQISVMVDLLEKLGCDNKAIGIFSSKQIFEDIIGYRHNVEIKPKSQATYDEDEVKKIIEMAVRKTASLMQKIYE